MALSIPYSNSQTKTTTQIYSKKFSNTQKHRVSSYYLIISNRHDPFGSSSTDASRICLIFSLLLLTIVLFHLIPYFNQINNTPINSLWIVIPATSLEIQSMHHKIKDKDDQPTGRQRIVIPSFDLYIKEVGVGSRPNRITIFAYYKWEPHPKIQQC